MTDDEAVADKATGVTSAEEQSNNNSAATKNGRAKKSRKRKKKRRKAKAKPVKADSNEGIKARFAACTRCCYFLGSYTSAHGEEALATAAQNGKSGWLTLPWDQQMRNLVHKAFGVRLDVDFYHYEGCCVACCRRFVYETGEENGTVFRVQL